jgi:hypothetical protein
VKKINLVLFSSLLSIASLSFASADDNAICKVQRTSIEVTYDSVANVVTETETADGQSSEPTVGVSYRLMDKNEALADQVVCSLAEVVGVNETQIISAAIFILAQNSSGSLAMIKYNLSDSTHLLWYVNNLEIQ